MKSSGKRNMLIAFAAVTLAFFASVVTVVLKNVEKAYSVSLYLIIAWGVFSLAVFLISYGRNRKKKAKPVPKNIENLILNSVSEDDTAVAVLNKKYDILWNNSSFSDLFEMPKFHFKKNAFDIIPSLKGKIGDEEIRTEIKDGLYGIHLKDISEFGYGFLLKIRNLSEVRSAELKADMLKEKLEKSETVLAYILVDNISEVLQYDTEEYKSISARISEELSLWAAPAGGVLKELERNRYVFIFEKQHLKDYISRDFDILEKIRNIRITSAQLSATISIGIADIYGSLADKDKAARAALDMALGRGGDQVVMKTDKETEFYGGRTKVSHRKSSVKSRVVANELTMMISEASNVLILGHKYPDFDCIGAALGIARLCAFCGVETNIVMDTKDRNLLLCIPFVSDVFDTDKLFIPSERAEEKIRTKTLIIIADANNLSIVDGRETVESVTEYAIIDHHRKMAEYTSKPALEYIESKASSTCEIISEILEHSLPQGVLSAGEADIMLAGMMLDTKRFSRMTGEKTYGAALYLNDCGADSQRVQSLFQRDISEYVKEAGFRSNVEIYKDIYAISVCSETHDISQESEDKIIASRVAEGLVGVRGISAAFAIIRLGDVYHISARSAGEVNVQLILEELNGGGHFDTAGAQLKLDRLTEVITLLKLSIDKYSNNNISHNTEEEMI